MNLGRKFIEGLKRLYKTWLPHIVTGFLLLYITFYSIFYLQFNHTTINGKNKISLRTEQRYTQTSKESRPHIVLGILSGEKNIRFRDTQRNTWIKTMLHLHKVLPFKITYTFLLDEPSSESTKENNLHKDIVYLNVSHHGRAVKFGEKMYVWWKYIHKVYPDALMGAKIDDDAFVCVPQMFNRLNTLKSVNLYYGWRHGKQRYVDIDNRIDEMFLVLGKDLISLISNRTYCGERKCKNKDDLIETNYGGNSLGEWLSIYSDKINFKSDNDRIVQTGPNPLAIAEKYLNPEFCDKKLVFHKSTCEIMQQLHSYRRES
ncbi:unnamed protein product [Mytilus coruscus]|uniref:Hexosyltransferase n=1 Tax=Mytilus coruscus TaxID=42192 RepID=A0A6J8DWL2_MYTCO|nr:unnamed protein product [Mytilus coruscus]